MMATLILWIVLTFLEQKISFNLMKKSAKKIDFCRIVMPFPKDGILSLNQYKEFNVNHMDIGSNRRKHSLYRWEVCMKMFYKSLREHAANVVNF